MRVKPFFLLATTVFAALTATAFAAEEEPPEYYCESDKDCQKKYPDTACIEVDNYGDIVRKCTPNTKTRPACRGGQPGLCPSYQSETQGYLNAHCVFTAEDGDDEEGGGDDSTPDDESKESSKDSSKKASTDGSKETEPTKKPSRILATSSKSKSASASEDASGSGSKPKSSSTSGGAAKNNGKTAKVKIGKEWVTGKFICIDISDCENKAADPTTCEPKECGSPGSKQQCNYQGTCTYGSIQTMSKRKCMCYKGFAGEKCQQEISNECDVDCGPGGDCKSGKCTCKAGWNGKKPDGYSKPIGKPSKRCAKCTSDNACENDNPCNVETGKCDCKAGFFGPVCGGTEDSCVKKDCGDGYCQVEKNGSSACYCPLCDPECVRCKDKKCTTCPSMGSTTDVPKLLIFVTAVLGLLLGNLVL